MKPRMVRDKRTWRGPSECGVSRNALRCAAVSPGIGAWSSRDYPLTADSERRVLRDPQIRLLQWFFHVGLRISDRVHGGHTIRNPEVAVCLCLLRDQAAEQRAENTGGDRCAENGSEHGFH